MTSLVLTNFVLTNSILINLISLDLIHDHIHVWLDRFRWWFYGSIPIIFNGSRVFNDGAESRYTGVTALISRRNFGGL